MIEHCDGSLPITILVPGLIGISYPAQQPLVKTILPCNKAVSGGITRSSPIIGGTPIMLGSGPTISALALGIIIAATSERTNEISKRTAFI